MSNHTPFLRYLTGILVVFLLGACSTYSEKDLQSFDDAINSYMEENNLQMERLENGLYYNIVDLGEGDDFIRITDIVTFYYTGSFLNGEVFQKIIERDPLTFHLRELIIGWQDALCLIKPAGRIQLILPPQLAYGDKKLELIPANTILVYDLTVVSVE